MPRFVRRLVALVATLAGPGCLAPGADVPDVRTPPMVVRAMLRLADVGPTDVIYDLGSGDGRIVITAARDFGARGVGVEIDPALVAESERGARHAGVSERVRFLQQDLFTADLREATVVTLYLGELLNLRLRPKLLAELRPGARIVSHQFRMGDWAPQRTVRVDAPEGAADVHLWVVPPPPGAGRPR